MQTEATANKIFTNTIGQVIFRALEVILGIIILGLITRYFGQSGFGYYTTVTAILQLFIVLVDFGLYLTLLREISADSQHSTEYITNNIVTMRAVSSAVFLMLAISIIAFTPYPIEVKLGVAALSASFFFASLITTVTALFQKHLQMVRIAGVQFFNKILLFLLILFIISNNLGLQSLFIGASILTGISFLMVWYFLRKLPSGVRLKLTYDPAYWRFIMSKTWPLAVTTAFNLIYFKADTIILSIFHSTESVGLYGASFRVLEIIATFPHMFMGLVLPVLTAAWIAKDLDKLNRVWQRAFIFFAFITLPLITGAFVVGKELMILIAGPDFIISGSILKILIIATGAIFFGTLYTYMVLVIGQQRRIVKYFIGTAVIALIGYFSFIPLYTYWGAAWMTVISEILIIMGAWLVIRRKVKLSVPWTPTLKLLFASILMALVTWQLQAFLPLIPLILVSGIVYVILALLLKALSFKELKNLIKP